MLGPHRENVEYEATENDGTKAVPQMRLSFTGKLEEDLALKLQAIFVV